MSYVNVPPPKQVYFVKGQYGSLKHPVFYIDYGYNSPVQKYFDASELKEMIYQFLEDGYEVVVKKNK